METWKREDIKDCPKTAQYFLENPDGSIALFYRIDIGTFNDGSSYEHLQYLSSFGVWMGTMERDPEKFIKDKLIKIV